MIIDEDTYDYLGGFTNSDCRSCHYDNVVPRDRVVPVSPWTVDDNEDSKASECEEKGGIWKDDPSSADYVEAYYPYDPYPYIAFSDDDEDDDDKVGSHGYITEVDNLWKYTFTYEPDPIEPLVIETDEITGLPIYPCLVKKINEQGEIRWVAVTKDGRLLDGNTAATRPNLFLQTYTKPDGSKSAWAIMAYEESKGMGAGPPETTGEGSGSEDGSGYDPFSTVPDAGKNAIYHSFDFQTPDLVSAGNILNLPETDDLGGLVYVEKPQYTGSSIDADESCIVDATNCNLVGASYYTGCASVNTCDPAVDEGCIVVGDNFYVGCTPEASCDPDDDQGCIVSGGTYYIGDTNDDYTPGGDNRRFDWKGEPQLAYENARRPRFILQPKSIMGASKTVLIALYKEGEDGAGRPSDIMARRFVANTSGNPYAFKHCVCNESILNENGETVCIDGAQNLSTVTPTETWINPDRSESAKGDGVKICRWEQTFDNLSDKSEANPYEDARAHRGGIRGDFVIMGYSYTPNWAASRNAHDKYDFYIRRSFDGGATWTTDPDPHSGTVEHIDIFFDPTGTSGNDNLDGGGTKHYEFRSSYEPDEWEPARNVSLLMNNKVSVIEPRIVAVPGTIKTTVNGVSAWTNILEDKQNTNCFYVAYGTSTNLKDVEKAPEDLFLSFSQDQGTTFLEDTWVVSPDSKGNNAGLEVSSWFRLAKGEPEQGEVQIRMTPNAERFYSVWLEEGLEGSDIFFRRIMDPAFPGNISEISLEDNDGDGYAAHETVLDDGTVSREGGDCNDKDPKLDPNAPLMNPSMPEICNDGLDNNCDGLTDMVPPGFLEDCGDGVDNDCDSDIDYADSDCTDDDGDGVTEVQGDCNDGNNAIYPDALDTPDDGIDQNCDGVDGIYVATQ